MIYPDSRIRKPRGAPRKAKLKSPESVNAAVKGVKGKQRQDAAGISRCMDEFRGFLGMIAQKCVFQA
jgi:hypothetical protein